MHVGPVVPITTFEIRPVRKTAPVSRKTLESVSDEEQEVVVARDGRKRERPRRPSKIAAHTTAASTSTNAVLSALIDLQTIR